MDSVTKCYVIPLTGNVSLHQLHMLYCHTSVLQRNIRVHQPATVSMFIQMSNRTPAIQSQLLLLVVKLGDPYTPDHYSSDVNRTLISRAKHRLFVQCRINTFVCTHQHTVKPNYYKKLSVFIALALKWAIYISSHIHNKLPRPGGLSTYSNTSLKLDYTSVFDWSWSHRC